LRIWVTFLNRKPTHIRNSFFDNWIFAILKPIRKRQGPG